MPDESRDKLLEELSQEHEPDAVSNLLNEARSQQPTAWGRIDRTRLLIWVGIAFAVPMILVYGFHLAKSGKGVLTVQSELPLKAVMAFFVALATWILSRIEKRSLEIGRAHV